jgi:hypothetical protein
VVKPKPPTDKDGSEDAVAAKKTSYRHQRNSIGSRGSYGNIPSICSAFPVLCVRLGEVQGGDDVFSRRRKL